jgi:hypothetical protein
MSRSRLLAAAVLALQLFSGALAEAAIVHTDDGCAVETHCNACLLRLRTPVIVTATFTVPRVGPVVELVAATPQALLQDEAPQRLDSRGPPSPSL